MRDCKAEIKLPGVTRSHRCGLPVVPGGGLCPLHLVLERRLKERARKHRGLLDYYRERKWMEE